eukprot:3647958-Pleurochrysis_carterae.AAC.1
MSSTFETSAKKAKTESSVMPGFSLPLNALTFLRSRMVAARGKSLWAALRIRPSSWSECTIFSPRSASDKYSVKVSFGRRIGW